MGLNEAQKDAVLHKDGPCLVLAGPGSGKTLTIVNRVKYLIEGYKVRPEEILVVTFTRFAAAEMRSRLCSLMGKERLPVTIGTFHGIYYGILRWTYRIGQKNLLSDNEKYQILRQVIRHQKLEIFDEGDFLKDIAFEIGKIKNQRIRPEEFISEKCEAAVFRQIYREYEEQRKRRRKIDFDDMLVLCFQLFLSRPDVLRGWQKKFRYILIDEFQDINQIQYDVIRMLALPERNLFAVGDDDQAIYGFRGADSELMLRFKKDFPDASQILLGVNYRSTSNIVTNSLKVIMHNTRRYEKELKAERKGGPCLHIQEVKDVNEEAEYIAGEIEKSIRSGTKAEDIAVLFRTHTDARPVVEALLARKLPFEMKEHLPNLYEHFIAKDIQAYFRLAMKCAGRQDLLQVMNRPKRYLSRESLQGKRASFEILRDYYRDKDWMTDRIDQFEWDVKMMEKMTPYAAITYLRKRVGYDEYLKEYCISRHLKITDLSEILSELEEAAKPYETMEEWFSHIEEYTEALKKRETGRNTPEKGIRLMTIHAAKGLEFDTVFVIQANEGRIPYKKAEKAEEIEEERRLFYVAMTRAKNRLVFSYVKIKGGKEILPSRFVDELLEK